jgi:DnaK suppressor protein
MNKDELLAMDSGSYMNSKQLSFFKNVLIKQKKELINTIDDAKRSLSEAERNTDLNDVASSQEMQQLCLRTVDRQGNLLRKVNEAMHAIDNGSYGYCEVTQEKIGLQRLLIHPTAKLSVYAKEIQEHKKKTQGIIKT